MKQMESGKSMEECLTSMGTVRPKPLPPGKEGKRFRIKLEQDYYEKGDILSIDEEQTFLVKVISHKDPTWWQRIINFFVEVYPPKTTVEIIKSNKHGTRTK